MRLKEHVFRNPFLSSSRSRNEPLSIMFSFNYDAERWVQTGARRPSYSHIVCDNKRKGPRWDRESEEERSGAEWSGEDDGDVEGGRRGEEMASRRKRKALSAENEVRTRSGGSRKKGESGREKRILRTCARNAVQRVRENCQEKKRGRRKEERCTEATEAQTKQRKRRSREDEDDREDETVVSSTVIKRRHWRRAIFSSLIAIVASCLFHF